MTETVTPVENGTDINTPETVTAIPVESYQTEQTEPVAEVPTGVEEVPEVEAASEDLDSDSDDYEEGENDGDCDDDDGIDEAA